MFLVRNWTFFVAKLRPDKKLRRNQVLEKDHFPKKPSTCFGLQFLKTYIYIGQQMGGNSKLFIEWNIITLIESSGNKYSKRQGKHYQTTRLSMA